jgi:hypothetical protein
MADVYCGLANDSRQTYVPHRPQQDETARQKRGRKLAKPRSSYAPNRRRNRQFSDQTRTEKGVKSDPFSSRFWSKSVGNGPN